MSMPQGLQLLPKGQTPGMSGNGIPGVSLHMSHKAVTISGKPLQLYAWILYRGSRGEKCPSLVSP